MGIRNNKWKNKTKQKAKKQTKACSSIWQESHFQEFSSSTFLSPCQRDKTIPISLIYNITYPFYVADIIISYPWVFNPNLINLGSRSIVLSHSQSPWHSQTILPSWISRLFTCLHLLLICVAYNKSSQQPQRACFYITTLRNGQTTFLPSFFFSFFSLKLKAFCAHQMNSNKVLFFHSLIEHPLRRS